MNIVASISNQRKLLMLAFPMILSNITTPLLGMVDTAVIGHLEHAYYLGGIALGSMVINIIFWLAGFLRMSTTGLISQSVGARDEMQAWRCFFHSMAVAICLSIVLILFHHPLSLLIFNAVDASQQVIFYADNYFSIRIFSAPAALINLVFLGYFVATQRVKWVVYQLFTINLINILLDVMFVVVFKWGVSGAALASVIADYCGLILLVIVILPSLKNLDLAEIIKPKMALFRRLFQLNRDIFIRSLALQLCFAFVTFRGAELGDVVVAANAILLNLFMFASYGLDGFAYAAESLVGEAKGEKKQDKIHQVVVSCAWFCATIALMFSLSLWLFGPQWIGLLTDLVDVKKSAETYLPWLIAICLIGWLPFLMDGVYIGLTQSKVMRNSMLLSTITFFVAWSLTQDVKNHALWFALCCFMAVRGVSLLLDYNRKRNKLQLAD